LQELNNGRLAMMGITGLIAQDGLLRVNMWLLEWDSVGIHGNFLDCTVT
jgi:hypothetical protein